MMAVDPLMEFGTSGRATFCGKFQQVAKWRQVQGDLRLFVRVPECVYPKRCAEALEQQPRRNLANGVLGHDARVTMQRV